jgi:hypothetical protein
MHERDPAWTWMSAAFALAAAIAACVLAVHGTGERAIKVVLFITARWSFLLFWLAYAGGGLGVLFGPVVQPLARHGREFGLSFAAAHLVHVGLVTWLCLIGAAPRWGLFYFFVPPLLMLYVIALFSIPTLHKKLSRRLWGILRTGGMTYIAYAFGVDFLANPFSGDSKHIILYAPFALMTVAGPALHLLGLMSRHYSLHRGSLTWKACSPRLRSRHLSWAMSLPWSFFSKTTKTNRLHPPST